MGGMVRERMFSVELGRRLVGGEETFRPFRALLAGTHTHAACSSPALLQVLTPCKKVRQVAAARPVLYLGSGPPPLPRAILPKDEEGGETESDVPSRANIARSDKPSPVGASGPEDRRNAGDGVKSVEDAGDGGDANAAGVPSASEGPSGVEGVEDGSRKTRCEDGIQMGTPTVRVGTEPLEVAEARTVEGAGTGR